MMKPNVWVMTQQSFKSYFCCFPPFHSELFLLLILMTWSGIETQMLAYLMLPQIIFSNWHCIPLAQSSSKNKTHLRAFPKSQNVLVTAKIPSYCLHTVSYILWISWDFFSTGICFSVHWTFAKERAGKGCPIRAIVHKDSCIPITIGTKFQVLFWNTWGSFEL